ncbi:OmpA family protein [Caminibacter sp.]
MKKIIAIASIAAVALFANTDNVKNDYEIGIAGGRSTVVHSSLKHYNFFNFRIGKFLHYNHILRFEIERGGNKITRVLMNVEHYFNTDSKITPYCFLGAGYQGIKGPYNNAFVGDLGAGTKFYISSKWDAFAEVRALRDFRDNDNHFGWLAGFVYKFSVGNSENETMPKVVQKPEKPKVVDSDHDGVPDNLDKCPNTPIGIKVDKNGCPLDSDHDGIPDYLDKCPNTPKGVQVDVNGCPVDSDHDGVPNYLDKCPNTPKGFKVDKNGCAITYNFEINFDNNSAKIKSEYMPKIEKFAEFLKSHPDIKAEIQGYTDNTGSKAYNMVLSEKRAKAVYEALIKLGVNKNQLSYKGYGPANPIASNATPEGRAKNRRVVAKIIY